MCSSRTGCPRQRSVNDKRKSERPKECYQISCDPYPDRWGDREEGACDLYGLGKKDQRRRNVETIRAVASQKGSACVR